MIRRHPAMTVAELIVSISIISILVAFLLPAVQSARETVRQLSCANNLRQLGVALNVYHDVHRAYPLNSSFGAPLGAEYPTRSWVQGILPFIEQASLHQRIDLRLTPISNRRIAETPLRALVCPSDSSPLVLSERADAPMSWELALTNYKSCAGSNWGWGSFRHKEQSGRFAGSVDGMAFGNGLICAGRGRVIATRVRDVRDGLTNTLAIGETIPHLTRWSWWYQSNSVTGTCAIPLNYGIKLRSPHRWQDNNGFMSRHSRGGQFACADASVRRISADIDMAIYRSLATIDGSELHQDY